MAEGRRRALMLELRDPYDPGVADVWTRLTARSYFTSWGWIENWLACLPRELAPRLAVWPDGETACLLSRRFAMRRRVIASRAYYMNVSGVPHLDELLVRPVPAIPSGNRTTRLDLCAALRSRVEERPQHRRQRPLGVRVEIPAGRAADLGQGGRVGQDDRAPLSHRLDDRDAEALAG